MRAFLRLNTFKFGEMQGLRYTIIAPEGGFHKSTKMGINNPTESKQYPMVVEDPNNPDCVIKMIFFYRERCNPSQKRFFCHVNASRGKDNPYYFKPESPCGGDSFRKWIREFAKGADFKDWEKYTTHDNRHR